MEKVLGINDCNLDYLEHLFGQRISIRGNQLTVSSDNPVLPSFFEHLIKLSSQRSESFVENELYMEWKSFNEEEGQSAALYELIVNSRSVWPKSRKQKEYIASLNENQVIFATGPAGTGKTFLAIAYALSQVLSGKKQKIVLTRPVVEAGESLGFLPGDLKQKLGPYLNPLYDAAEYVLSPQQIKRMEENGTLEIAPLAYMRGRSVNNAVMILDEAQNATRSQIKMFLTRLGENCQAIVTGDPSQTDLRFPADSGLEEAVSILSGIKGVSVVRFTHSDTVRSRIVREIVRAYSEKEGE